jgi:CRISPR-associated protein Csx14
MSNVTVRIDPANPGHFFACCGLIELVSQVRPRVHSRFILDERRPRKASFELCDVEEVLVRERLQTLSTTEFSPAFEDPDMRAILPIRAQHASASLTFTWWLGRFHDRATALKGWGGQVTSEKLFRDLAAGIELPEDFTTLFEVPRPTSSRFGVDPRSSWNALDVGYSPNEQGQEADSFPNVELLSAYGLQSFRPTIGRRRTVPYFLWTQPLHRIPARTAAFHPWPGLPGWNMQFSIEGRGQSYKYFAFGNRVHPDDTATDLTNQAISTNDTED